MRLTNTQRDAFVHAVMADVPMTIYQDEAIAIVRKFEREWVASMSKKLLAVYDDKEVSQYLDRDYNAVYASDYFNSGLNSIITVNGFPNKGLPMMAELDKVSKKAADQRAKREELKATVRAAIYGCASLDAAKKALPEFVKYMPVEPSKSALPLAIINPAKLLKKAGWPMEAVAA